MSLRFRLAHLLARVVCRLRGHRYVYGRQVIGGVAVAYRRCRRCQHCDQMASLLPRRPAPTPPMPRRRTLAEELPSA